MLLSSSRSICFSIQYTHFIKHTQSKSNDWRRRSTFFFHLLHQFHWFELIGDRRTDNKWLVRMYYWTIIEIEKEKEHVCVCLHCLGWNKKKEEFLIWRFFFCTLFLLLMLMYIGRIILNLYFYTYFDSGSLLKKT